MVAEHEDRGASAAVVRQRDRAAAAAGDFLRARTLEGLLERIEPMTLRPARCLDIGAARGRAARAIAKRWRRGNVVAVDVSADMLAASRQSRSRFSRIREVRASAAGLPFKDGSFDLATSNLGVATAGALPAAFREVARVLRPEGLFAFALPGPDTLAEIRSAWAAVDDEAHVAAFADMHDVGDLLLRAGFRDPVLDVERMTLTYAEPHSLYRDLTAAGARNALGERRRTLTGRDRFAEFERRLSAGSVADERFGVTIEIVFGHAWSAGPRRPPGEFVIGPQDIGRRR